MPSLTQAANSRRPSLRSSTSGSRADSCWISTLADAVRPLTSRTIDGAPMLVSRIGSSGKSQG